MNGWGQGVGINLYRAASGSSYREPVWAGMRNPQEIIPTGESSVGFAVNAGQQTVFSVVFAAAPAGTAVTLYASTTPDFTSEYALDTIAATADTTYQWTTNYKLTGFIRLANGGGQNITSAKVDQTLSTVG